LYNNNLLWIIIRKNKKSYKLFLKLEKSSLLGIGEKQNAKTKLTYSTGM
jgi:hypothetical protein